MCARRGERTNRGGKRWYRKERKRDIEKREDCGKRRKDGEE
jgi:hypothetical protein